MASTEALVKSIKFNKDIKLTELKIHRPDRQIISKYILDNLKIIFKKVNYDNKVKVLYCNITSTLFVNILGRIRFMKGIRSTIGEDILNHMFVRKSYDFIY